LTTWEEEDKQIAVAQADAVRVFNEHAYLGFTDWRPDWICMCGIPAAFVASDTGHKCLDIQEWRHRARQLHIAYDPIELKCP
jgi:hypothetical protein